MSFLKNFLNAKREEAPRVNEPITLNGYVSAVKPAKDNHRLLSVFITVPAENMEPLTLQWDANPIGIYRSLMTEGIFNDTFGRMSPNVKEIVEAGASPLYVTINAPLQLGKAIESLPDLVKGKQELFTLKAWLNCSDRSQAVIIAPDESAILNHWHQSQPVNVIQDRNTNGRGSDLEDMLAKPAAEWMPPESYRKAQGI